jgi:hypothetical protein
MYNKIILHKTKKKKIERTKDLNGCKDYKLNIKEESSPNTISNSFDVHK